MRDFAVVHKESDVFQDNFFYSLLFLCNIPVFFPTSSGYVFSQHCALLLFMFFNIGLRGIYCCAFHTYGFPLQSSFAALGASAALNLLAGYAASVIMCLLCTAHWATVLYNSRGIRFLLLHFKSAQNWFSAVGCASHTSVQPACWFPFWRFCSVMHLLVAPRAQLFISHWVLIFLFSLFISYATRLYVASLRYVVSILWVLGCQYGNLSRSLSFKTSFSHHCLFVRDATAVCWWLSDCVCWSAIAPHVGTISLCFIYCFNRLLFVVASFVHCYCSL